MTRLLALFRALERAVLAAIMLGMVALYAGAVLVREIAPHLASRVAWADEATRILLVWMIFLALGLALERGRHVAMTTLLERLPALAGRAVARLIDAVGLAFCAYLAWLGWRMTVFVAGTGQSSPTLGISMAWLYAVLPIGFGLLGLRYGLSLVGVLDRRRSVPAAGEPTP